MADSARAGRRPWRDALEAVTMAVVMAVFLKYFVVEAYRIPTGSMQPTLFGDARSGVFDRILVDKLSYAFRDPRRFEVVVFRFPLDRSKSFVKRVWGIGPEDLKIEHGDVWHRHDESEPWTILRRPRSVERAAWKELDVEAPSEASWSAVEARSHAVDEGDGWSFAGRTIAARGDGKARFRPDLGPIVDHYLDGYPETLAEIVQRNPSASGANFVADLRVAGRAVALEGSRAVVIQIDEGDLRYSFRLPGPASATDARPSILVTDVRSGKEVELCSASAEQACRLEAGDRVDFAAQNLDDRLELELDGSTVLGLDIEPSADQVAAVFLLQEGVGADFSDLMVSRDIYYTSTTSKSAQVSIPANHYFMLGDNTQDSSDSREWTFARFQVPTPDGARLLRGPARRGDNPRTLGLGDPDGPRTRFVDEWGNVHWFPRQSAEVLSPETAPLVPRAMIQGRAVAVFWPLDPRRSVYRLKWVN